MREHEARRYLNNAIHAGQNIHAAAVRALGPFDEWGEAEWEVARDVWPVWFGAQPLLPELRIAATDLPLDPARVAALFRAAHGCAWFVSELSRVGLVPGPRAIPAEWGEGIPYTRRSGGAHGLNGAGDRAL